MPSYHFGEYIIGYPLVIYLGYMLIKILIKKMALPLLLKLHAWKNGSPKSRKEPPAPQAPPPAKT